MEIAYYSKFKKQFKKLSNEIKILTAEKEGIFKTNSFDVRLKTHKLSGKLEGLYSFSINHSYRVIFDFQSIDVARFYEIGNHDIYD